jgi:hypothetical protein
MAPRSDASAPRAPHARALACALALALALAAVLGGGAVPAAASPAQESLFMDDPQIVHAEPERVERTFERLAGLGVDRVRVSVLWHAVAPEPRSKRRPDFAPGGPADPQSYPHERWDRYDTVARAARRHGIGLLFTITGPAPLWATGTPERQTIEDRYLPSPADFQAFVAAVGTRYSGTYVDEDDRRRPPPPSSPFQPQPAPPTAEPLPRVDHWSIWNEPNHPSWLTPQWFGSGRRAWAAAPHVYRGLVDAAWHGLEASGHAGDVVLLGETAPRGWPQRNVVAAMRPLEFVRELYCLDRSGRPYAGPAASARGCPRDAAARAAFVSEHPALFSATGWAHHPYGFDAAPARASAPHPDDAQLADVGRLGRTLDRAQRRWGSRRQLGLWMTEYGYQTNPPDPLGGVSPGRQAAWLNEAEWLAYRSPRVVAMSQFLLVDDRPAARFPARDPRYWSTFQTGLLYADGSPKPSLAAYRAPIHVTPARARRGERLRVFGGLRGGAREGRRPVARLEFVARGSSRAAQVATVTAANPRGYVELRVRARRSGAYRLVWTDPVTGQPVASRSAPVRVR